MNHQDKVYRLRQLCSDLLYKNVSATEFMQYHEEIGDILNEELILNLLDEIDILKGRVYDLETRYCQSLESRSFEEW